MCLAITHMEQRVNNRAIGIAITVLLASCSPGPRQGDSYTLQGNLAGCVSRDAYDAYLDAVIWMDKTGDASRLLALYEGDMCVLVRSGDRVRVLRPGVLVSEICYPATPCGTTLYASNERLQN